MPPHSPVCLTKSGHTKVARRALDTDSRAPSPATTTLPIASSSIDISCNMSSGMINTSADIDQKVPEKGGTQNNHCVAQNNNKVADPTMTGPSTSSTPAPLEVVPAPDAFAEDMRLIAENRDREAYTRVFRHFAPRLIEFSRRQMVSDQQAMELVQETMLLIWKKAHLYDPARASTTTWVYRICRNLRFDMLRKQLHLKDEISADDLWPSLEEAGLITSNSSMVRKIEAEQVLQYYLQLPPAQQEIVRMLYLEEKSHQEVADELEIPLGTVKSRIRLAINRLKQYIDSHD